MQSPKRNVRILLWIPFLSLLLAAGGTDPPARHKKLTADDYVKHEYRIPMRDGVHLFTSVYIPKDRSRTYPILMQRTPYSVAPYGKEKRKHLGPSDLFMEDGYIFVYQDVRGRFMSEGTFVNMRPMRHRRDSTAVDESTDTWDTVEWLIHNIEGNNGKVGIWGISYPGFYASAAAVDAHPAVRAISPQAPIADWFFDDFHHHGAFFLPHSFNFLAVFGQPRRGLTTSWGERFDHGTPDGYAFFMRLGPLARVNTEYFHHGIPFWDSIVLHPDYDRFWRERNILPHLTDIRPAILVVGGWYDAEDLYGTFATYEAMERFSSGGEEKRLVVGPWRHGGWARGNGDHLGWVWFPGDPPPSVYYREKIEYPFFSHYLKGRKTDLPKVTMYETGRGRWVTFDRWPPSGTHPATLYLHSDGTLTPTSGDDGKYREFISDPAKAVPYTERVTIGMSAAYMTDDQRFAGRRPDVLVYVTPVLENDITLAGKSEAELYVSTTAGDADWVVKLIDVYPDDHPDYPGNPSFIRMGGYQQMVRSEVFRGRYRNSYEHPEPFVPGRMTKVRIPLQDILHTFRAGHRIMVQVQNTWFPLVDRNPQRYVENIYTDAKEEDFIPATQRVYGMSALHFQILEGSLPAAER